MEIRMQPSSAQHYDMMLLGDPLLSSQAVSSKSAWRSHSFHSLKSSFVLNSTSPGRYQFHFLCVYEAAVRMAVAGGSLVHGDHGTEVSAALWGWAWGYAWVGVWAWAWAACVRQSVRATARGFTGVVAGRGLISSEGTQTVTAKAVRIFACWGFGFFLRASNFRQQSGLFWGVVVDLLQQHILKDSPHFFLMSLPQLKAPFGLHICTQIIAWYPNHRAKTWLKAHLKVDRTL